MHNTMIILIFPPVTYGHEILKHYCCIFHNPKPLMFVCYLLEVTGSLCFNKSIKTACEDILPSRLM